MSLDNLLTSLKILAAGHLSYKIVTPGMLNSYLQGVETDLRK